MISVTKDNRFRTDYERIAKAIGWIAEHRLEQPDVASMAEVVALSEAHFSRMFKRWSGISPQRYLASLTIGDARRALRADATVEAAAQDVGLSSAGRLHDLFVRIDAVSPGEYKRLGDGLRLDYAFAESPFGDALLVESTRGIVALTLDEHGRRDQRLAAFSAQWARASIHENQALADKIRQYLNPVSARLQQQVTVVMGGTPFQHKVWQALLDVAVGDTRSYGALARTIGHAGASRAVGSAVANNAVAVLIPCHRVLRAGGALGEYRWGAERKRLLLAWEHCQQLRA